MFDLATPWFLLLLPLPFLIRWFLPVKRQNETLALKVPFFDRFKLIETHKSAPNTRFVHKNLLLPFVIWCLLCIVLSGPQWLGKPLELPQSGRDIMLALDLSGSMQTPDMKLQGKYLTRLAVVKIAARKFIEARKGDRLGLVLFGTRAYLQTPLTFDQQTVLDMLDDATIGLAGPQTAIGDGLGLSLKQLENAPGHSKVIVLLTDGGNNAGNVAPLDAAAMAKKMGIKIYTIGIGAKELEVEGLFGPEIIHPTSEVDVNTLKEIAKMTGGLFFRADSGDKLEEIYQAIDQLMPVVSASNIYRPIKPLYPWPLSLAFLLSFYLALRQLNIMPNKITGETN